MQAVDLNDMFAEVRSQDPDLAVGCHSDSVALLALLVPWQDGYFPAPLLVVSACLAAGATNDAVRAAQVCLRAREAPVIAGPTQNSAQHEQLVRYHSAQRERERSREKVREDGRCCRKLASLSCPFPEVRRAFVEGPRLGFVIR